MASLGCGVLLPGLGSAAQIAMILDAEKLMKEIHENDIRISMRNIFPHYAVGDLPFARECIERGVAGFHIEAAHGGATHVLDAVSELRRSFGDEFHIIAGNAVTSEIASLLVNAGANTVKIGLGTGSACTTSQQIGYGRELADALLEITEWRDVDSSSTYLIADGGLSSPGEIVKALALGADAVALGRMLAGTNESAGRLVKRMNTIYKTYAANRYRTLDIDNDTGGLEPTEGLRGIVPLSGSLSRLLKEIRTAVGAGLALAGAAGLESLRDAARFAVLSESSAPAIEDGLLEARPLRVPIRSIHVEDGRGNDLSQLELFPKDDSEDVGVVVIIWQDESKRRVLLGERRDGTLAFPGGRWARGERLTEAALREAYEETRAVIKDLRLVSVHEVFDSAAGRWRVSIGFEAILNPASKVEVGDGGLIGLKWQTVASIFSGRKGERFFGSDREFLKKIVDNMPIYTRGGLDQEV
jgi:ADP-ribose pyrophosphatase YjhB (NUDIX family)/IMP dehydrogenase/GMP reductase